ncbi:MAG: hypothetical protein Q9157_004410 [Trypethelium eluteriae]
MPRSTTLLDSVESDSLLISGFDSDDEKVSFLRRVFTSSRCSVVKSKKKQAMDGKNDSREFDRNAAKRKQVPSLKNSAETRLQSHQRPLPPGQRENVTCALRTLPRKLAVESAFRQGREMVTAGADRVVTVWNATRASKMLETT